MTGMLYSDYTAALADLLVIPATDPNLVTILPRCIEYAELRLYRELTLEANSVRITTISSAPIALTAGNRNLVLPVGTFVWIDNINVIVPAGTSNPEAGSRNPLTRVSWDLLDMVYGSASSQVPKYYALQDAATIAVGPWPDQAYNVEILGTIRPAPLSASNTSTTLSTFFPDLLIAASMVFLSGYTQDFGQQADDPTKAMSWETTYKTLFESAATEEARKRATVSRSA